MAKLLAFGLFAFVHSADAMRRTDSAEMTCDIEGPSGLAVTFPVEKGKCSTQCVKATKWDGMGDTLNSNKQFALLLSTSLDDLDNHKCVCSITEGGELKKLVQYRAVGKGKRDECRENTDQAKIDCWEIYKKARSTTLDVQTQADGSDMVIARKNLDKVREALFVIQKTCTECRNEACHAHSVPSLLSDLSTRVQIALGKVILNVRKGEKISGVLRDLALALPDRDIDAVQFVNIDKDGDEELDADELHEFFPDFTKEKIEHLIAAVDANGNGTIDFDEFAAFKDKMRRASAVDEITGESISVATWEVTEVKCLKDGKEVDASQCGDSQEAAMDSFNSCL